MAASAGRSMPKILGDLRLAARTGAFLTLTPTCLALMEAERRGKADGDPILRKWMSRYGELACRAYGLELKLAGPYLERGEPYPARDGRGRGRIFVFNHRSMHDVFVSVRVAAGTFVARSDVSGWPLIGFIANRIGTLWVDRQSRESGAAVVSAMQGAVLEGRPVSVFPEGTTFEGDLVRPFRSGAFRVAVAAGVEIVPFGLAYGELDDAYGDEGFGAHYRRAAGKRRTLAAVVSGEPLRAEGLDAEGLRAAAQARVQELVLAARGLLA
jgi:1-acyl-sn-glycerol-3-phosphate acyltransferase